MIRLTLLLYFPNGWHFLDGLVLGRGAGCLRAATSRAWRSPGKRWATATCCVFGASRPRSKRRRRNCWTASCASGTCGTTTSSSGALSSASTSRPRSDSLSLQLGLESRHLFLRFSPTSLYFLQIGWLFKLLLLRTFLSQKVIAVWLQGDLSKLLLHLTRTREHQPQPKLSEANELWLGKKWPIIGFLFVLWRSRKHEEFFSLKSALKNEFCWRRQSFYEH